MALNIGILGAGRIAEKLARTFALLPEVRSAAVGARELTRAQEFALRHGIPKAYGSYKELAEDPTVELIYIATPQALHFEHMMLCLRHGKHIFCEKTFTCTADEAEQIFAEAKRRKLFAAEAIWPRYMPMAAYLSSIRETKPVGEIIGLTANLSYPVYHQKERLRFPELGGGALYDVGIYPLTFASIVLGDHVENVYGYAVYSDTGVDVQNAITLQYSGGQMAVLHSSVLASSDRRGIIFCTEGYIEVENVNNFERVSIFDSNHRLLQRIDREPQLTGYEYEVLAVARAIERNALECPEMPAGETLRMMRLLDRIRYQWSVSSCEERRSHKEN